MFRWRALAGYRPKKKWEFLPATSKQLDYLDFLEIPYHARLTLGEASYLIERAERTLKPSRVQESQLLGLGLWRPEMTRADASRVLREFKRERHIWERP